MEDSHDRRIKRKNLKNQSAVLTLIYIYYNRRHLTFSTGCSKWNCPGSVVRLILIQDFLNANAQRSSKLGIHLLRLHF